MDSAKGSSLHSSSCGDDEFDSRTHSLSAAFFPSAAAFQPPLKLHNSFEPLSDLHSTSLLPNLPSQLTTVTSRGVGVGIGALGPSLVQPPGLSSTTASAAALPRRSSKKRARSSQRAPTTVLATDTSNFRAMVQEFTGIPSPPFTRARLNLFGSVAPATSSSVAASLLPHPFMPTLQAPCFPPISSSASSANDASASSNTTNNPYPLGRSFLQPPLHAEYTLPSMPAFTVETRPPPQASQPASYNLNELGLPPGLIASEGLRSNYAAVSQNDKE